MGNILLESLNESQRENLREIKKGFRQSMNADLSNSMRELGLGYSLNFGVPAPRVKLIASKIEPDRQLAEYLWQENVRESKMIATYLFPLEEMDIETAQRWISEVKYTEIADQLSRNLLMRLSYVKELMNRNIASSDKMERYIGMRLLSFLIASNDVSGIDFPFVFNEIKENIVSGVSYLTSAVVNIADNLYGADEELLNEARLFFSPCRESENSLLRNFYSLLEEDEE